jgi:molecular chaperone IbpA
MTNWPTYKFDHTFTDLAKFDKFFVGADKFFERARQTAELVANTAQVAYPPFNLKKTDDNVYVIEMAVAGFAKQDIELTLEDNKLKIAGKVENDENENTDFLYKGISARPFERSFVLNDNVVINNAQYVNGLLKIWLEHIIPEDKKPKKIDIADGDAPASKSKKQLLTE